MIDLGHVITAMVTPFKEDGSVNYKKAEELANFLADNGSDGLVLHGTTGESPTLTHEEEYELYKVVKAAAAKKTKIIAGTGSNSTATTIASTKKAESLGVDAAMVVVPYYNKPSQEGMYQHFKAIADNTGLPLIIYNIPGRCGVNMEAATVARLSKIKNYVAIKEAAGSLDQVSNIRMMTDPEFVIYSGDDSLTLPMLAVGAKGVISVVSHVAGKMIHEMIDLYFRGQISDAQKMHNKLMPLFKAAFVTSNPSPIKEALNMLGHNVGPVRLPLVKLTDKEKEILRAALKYLKLI